MSPLPQDAAKCKALRPNRSETRAKFAQTRGKIARIFAASSFVMADKISSACLARRHFGVQSIADGLILYHRSYREHIAIGLPKRPTNTKFTLIKTPPFCIDTYMFNLVRGLICGNYETASDWSSLCYDVFRPITSIVSLLITWRFVWFL